MKIPPTITAPLPHDPRVLKLAGLLDVSRREAFAAAAEAWAWVATMSADGIVVEASLDTIDAVADVPGFGRAMLDADLIGTADGGIVLPAELRHPSPAAGQGGRVYDMTDPEERKRALNAQAAKRCRRRKKISAAATVARNKNYRLLGRIGVHEIRAYDGKHGVYARVINARLGGKQYKQLTQGAKHTTLETVALSDVLPGLADKWRAVHDREQAAPPEQRKLLEPGLDEVLQELKKLPEHDASSPKHDASCRHDDASCFASSSSQGPAGRKSSKDNGLGAAKTMMTRHHDGASSNLLPIPSSKEEGIGKKVVTKSATASPTGGLGPAGGLPSGNSKDRVVAAKQRMLEQTWRKFMTRHPPMLKRIASRNVAEPTDAAELAACMEDAEKRRELTQSYGAKRHVRVITASTRAEAEELLSQVLSDPMLFEPLAEPEAMSITGVTPQRELKAAAFALTETGQVSGIVECENRFLIIRAERVEPAGWHYVTAMTAYNDAKGISPTASVPATPDHPRTGPQRASGWANLCEPMDAAPGATRPVNGTPGASGDVPPECNDHAGAAYSATDDDSFDISANEEIR